MNLEWKLTAVSGASPSPQVETITSRFSSFARSCGEISDMFFITALKPFFFASLIARSASSSEFPLSVP